MSDTARPSEAPDDAPGLLEVVWRFRWLVLVLTLAGGAAGYGFTLLQDPVYEARVELLLGDPRQAGVFQELTPGAADSARHVRNQARRIGGGTVVSVAAELLDGEQSPREIRANLRVEPLVDIDVIEVYGYGPTRAEAVALADAVGEAYQRVRTEEVLGKANAAIAELDETATQLRTDLRRVQVQLRGQRGDMEGQPEELPDAALLAEQESLSSQLAVVEGRANQITVDAALYGSGIEEFERALGASQHQPRPDRTVPAGVLLGFVLGATAAWWRATRAESVTDPHLPERVLGAPLLGQVSDFEKVGVSGSIPMVSSPQSVTADAYHFIVGSLVYALDAVDGKVVVVTSGTPGEGKTVTALNLALAASRDGRRVNLVDADVRMQGLAALCDAQEQASLTRLDEESVPFQWAVADNKLFDENVALIPMGIKPADPAGFFRSTKYRQAMRRVRNHADLVIVDSPPLLAVSETSVIASGADGIVLVVRRGTSQSALEEVRARLDFLGTPLLGYVFNAADPRLGGRYGEYLYGAEEPANGKSSRRRFGRTRREPSDVT